MTSKRSKTHKPSPSQAFSLGRQESPRSNQPIIAPKGKATLTEAANARIRTHENYFATIEAEKEAARDWNDSSQAFFAKFRNDRGE